MKINLLAIFFLLFISLYPTETLAQKSKFKVVLDAGHGGKDPGAIQNGYYEKKIALNVVLKVGKLLTDESDIELIYTRKTDVFITLKERANIANRNDANLFVSVHCNSNPDSRPNGSETYVMGMSRTNTNLDVAKKENGVILLEDDYKENYKGFDPNKPESLIGLKLLQEEFINQSISLATKVQDNFTTSSTIKNRGVKQQPIWVLDASYMPSVLIEMGFLSNKSDGAYLNSEEGQNTMANAIANAIISYKKENFNPSETEVFIDKPKAEVEKPKEEHKKPEVKSEEPKKVEPPKNTSKYDIVFKVQISAGTKNLETKSSNFKGLKHITKEKSKTIYKYFYENTSSYDEAKKYLEQAKKKGFNTAFIVAYKDGKEIKLTDALN